MKKIQWLLAIPLAIATVNGCKEKTRSTQKFIETTNMDSSVKPGDDFFLFVNGKWIKNTDIPSTESGVGAFLDLYNRTKANLKTILEDVSKGGQAAGSIEQKVGDFYASGMDSATIETIGYKPLQPAFASIATIKDAKGVMGFLGIQLPRPRSGTTSHGPDRSCR